ncbi:MAG TPA: hypothetical protein DCE71_04125, partial [Parachlamydiales bacterium]|nr:hypothetical protein [Parachlamydiales bacterium]
MSITKTATLTTEPSRESYKAQEKTPTWKVVAAVAFLVIATVALVLFLASPLSPVAFPLSIALKPMIFAQVGVVIAALTTGGSCIAKNNDEKTQRENQSKKTSQDPKPANATQTVSEQVQIAPSRHQEIISEIQQAKINYQKALTEGSIIEENASSLLNLRESLRN